MSSTKGLQGKILLFRFIAFLIMFVFSIIIKEFGIHDLKLYKSSSPISLSLTLSSSLYTIYFLLSFSLLLSHPFFLLQSFSHTQTPTKLSLLLSSSRTISHSPLLFTQYFILFLLLLLLIPFVLYLFATALSQYEEVRMPCAKAVTRYVLMSRTVHFHDFILTLELSVFFSVPLLF